MPSVTPFQVTFDCVQPVRVARFWCEVLGYVEEVDPDAPLLGDSPWAACVDPTGVGPRLFFQRVPEGKVAKNRLHLDVRVGTGLVGEERVATLEAEGGTWNVPVETDRPNDVAYVSDVIDQVSAQACVDPARIYATGFSGGARMSSLLGCGLGARQETKG